MSHNNSNWNSGNFSKKVHFHLRSQEDETVKDSEPADQSQLPVPDNLEEDEEDESPETTSIPPSPPLQFEFESQSKNDQSDRERSVFFGTPFQALELRLNSTILDSNFNVNSSDLDSDLDLDDHDHDHDPEADADLDPDLDLDVDVENNNENPTMVQWESQDQDQEKPFDKDQDPCEDLVLDLTRPRPKRQEFSVFNVFHDLGRLVGIRRRKGRVKFHKEFLEHYAETGDVAGKDRFVPQAKMPYNGVAATKKKRKLSAVYSTWSVKANEFVPKVERIENTNCVEYYCERFFISCDCFKCSKNKPDLTPVMEGYLNDMNVASQFFQGHTTRTFDTAMGNLEFVEHETALPDKVQSEGQGQGHRKSLFPVTGSLHHRMGILTQQIWIFGWCFRTMVKQAGENSAEENAANLPSENGLRKILECFTNLCLTCVEGVKVVMQYSHNFYNFCRECIRLLKVIQVHVRFRARFRVKRPLRRGDGLQVNRKLTKTKISQFQLIQVNVSQANTDNPESDENPEEKESSEEVKGQNAEDNRSDSNESCRGFQDLSGNDKIGCLRNLIENVSDGMASVQTQLRFLLDDIVDSAKDVTEADLLFLLSDMFDRIRYLENVGSIRVKREMEQISSLMAEFSIDFQNFIDSAQQIMKRYVELRDMMHLTYEFLTSGLKLSMLNEMVPSGTFKRKLNFRCIQCLGYLGGCMCCSDCCYGSKVKSRKKVIQRFIPKYKALDFLRVPFEDMVKCSDEIQVYRYAFSLTLPKGQSSEDKIGSGIFPVFPQYNWGEMDSFSPIQSMDDFFDPDADDRDPDDSDQAIQPEQQK